MEDVFSPDVLYGRAPVRDAAVPRFFIEAVEQTFKSEQAGRPVFEDVEFVEIVILGDNKTRAVEKVNQGHVDRWPQYYAKFKKGQQDTHDGGTPLKEWPPVRPSQIAELNALNVYTVEHLARVPDNNLDRLGPGARALRDKAAAWLKASEDSGEIMRLVAANKRLEERVRELEERLATSGDEPQEERRRPGRPRKTSDLDIPRGFSDE